MSEVPAGGPGGPSPPAGDGRPEPVVDRARSPRGHRLVPHTADTMIEAWGPDRAACLTEALVALVAGFAEVPEVPVTRLVPLDVGAVGPEDQLVSLLEDVIFTLDTLSVVPVRFHLAETESGGVAGDMEVVPAGEAVRSGPVPKAVSYHGLSMLADEEGWRCRVLVDV
ncbi:MAG TPA: archease [Acidimicrobiales bacterium]|nr:archease [Acidimicrobiales bacterium]